MGKNEDKVLELVFAGEPLKKVRYPYGDLYSNRDVQVSCHSDRPYAWIAEPNQVSINKGRLKSLDGVVDTLATEPQQALDKMYEKALHEFKKLGAALGYDVED